MKPFAKGRDDLIPADVGYYGCWYDWYSGMSAAHKRWITKRLLVKWEQNAERIELMYREGHLKSAILPD